MKAFPRLSLFCVLVLIVSPSLRGSDTPRGFTVTVVDDRTNRGVPLIRLTAVDQTSYFTDSNGIAFVDDSILIGREVFLTVTGDGYEFQADGMGYHGTAIELKPGGTRTLKIHRKNIAERLYRLTGAGIYRDTILAGQKSPIEQPLMNADVVGQDSCQAIVYKGKIRWFFGDTAWLKHPLGQFGTSGAVSDLPGRGGLDPAVGVNLKYFVGANGFSRRMLPRYDKGAGWLDSLITLKDESGHERMLAKADNVPGLGKPFSTWWLTYNDEKDVFEPLARVPDDAPLGPRGQAFVAADHGASYIYFPLPFPNVRVVADYQKLQNPSEYEAYTCLKPGETFDAARRKDWANVQLDRDPDGRLIWDWKKNTSAIDTGQLVELIKAGKMKVEDSPFTPRDVETKQQIDLHTGSVYFNAYRKKWVMIGQQAYGKPSPGGEIWFSEADEPSGPWRWARRILTHDHFTFYNPVQHPFFDQDGGRVIYFEGTYSMTFSGRDDATPLYDYNQIMYRLDLSDPRLKLPD